eukprot:6597811-Pyramimonas_sp.AAC.1
MLYQGGGPARSGPYASTPPSLSNTSYKGPTPPPRHDPAFDRKVHFAWLIHLPPAISPPGHR